jgi:hypothetical protein
VSRRNGQLPEREGYKTYLDPLTDMLLLAILEEALVVGDAVLTGAAIVAVSILLQM